MNAIESLTARVEKLERRSRIWAGLCFLSLAAAPLLAAAGSERRVEAGGFVLRDLRGQRRAALVTTADGATALSLRDAKGVERISLAVAPDGRPSLTVSDAFSHPRVRIALARESSLNFYDRRGKLRAARGKRAMLLGHARVRRWEGRADRLRSARKACPWLPPRKWTATP